MTRTTGITALMAAGLWLAAGAGPAGAAGRLNQAKVDQDVAAAREALNEVASRLGIGNADAARFALGEAWRAVGRVRGAYGELSRLRMLVTQLGSGQVLTAQQSGHLDKIQFELDKLAKQYRMPVAYDRLAAAREAREKRQTVVMRREAQAVLDAAVSAMSGAPVLEWAEALREAEAVLASPISSEARVAAATSVLKAVASEESFSRRVPPPQPEIVEVPTVPFPFGNPWNSPYQPYQPWAGPWPYPNPWNGGYPNWNWYGNRWPGGYPYPPYWNQFPPVVFPPVVIQPPPPPVTQPPVTQPPATQPPNAQPPAAQPQPPATQPKPPTTQPPETQPKPPATQPPSTQPPATQPPTAQPPPAQPKPAPRPVPRPRPFPRRG